MPNGSYIQVDVRCPFYRGDDGRQRIVCEGIVDGSTFSIHFPRKSDWSIQVDTFCCRHYERCEVFRMIMDAKYPAEYWDCR